jgi:hypothetical protein
MRFVCASVLGASLLLSPTITKAQARDKPPTTATGATTTADPRHAPAESSGTTATTGSPETGPTASPPQTDAAPTEEKTWPTVLIFTGGGITALGAVIGGVAYASQIDSIKSSNQHYRSAKSWGCWGGAQACAQYVAAHDAAYTAHEIVVWATAGSALLGAALFSIGVIGHVSSPAQVQVAPTLGGAILSGRF